MGKEPFTMVFLDFNRFKRINDTYGHDVGDKVLIHFAESIAERIRKTDKLYRFGGDEFALVIDKEHEVKAIVDKLEEIKDTLVLEYGEHRIPYSFSVGVFEYDGHNCKTMDELVGKASHKMEQDKQIMHAAEDARELAKA